MFSKIHEFRKNLPPNNQLFVNHEDISWTAEFKWQPAVNEDKKNELLHKFKKHFPLDYLEFISNISNGAILFYEMEYGQGGIHIYSLEEITEPQYKWIEEILSDKKQYIVFAEMIGESVPLFFDTQIPNNDNTGYQVIAANPIIAEFDVIANSFREWLDLVIDSQGEKYWE